MSRTEYFTNSIFHDPTIAITDIVTDTRLNTQSPYISSCQKINMPQTQYVTNAARHKLSTAQTQYVTNSVRHKLSTSQTQYVTNAARYKLSTSQTQYVTNSRLTVTDIVIGTPHNTQTQYISHSTCQQLNMPRTQYVTNPICPELKSSRTQYITNSRLDITDIVIGT